MGVGTTIMQLRSRAGLMQEELANRLDPPLSHVAVAAWEAGKSKLRYRVLSQLAVIFNGWGRWFKSSIAHQRNARSRGWSRGLFSYCSHFRSLHVRMDVSAKGKGAPTGAPCGAPIVLGWPVRRERKLRRAKVGAPYIDVTANVRTRMSATIAQLTRIAST